MSKAIACKASLKRLALTKTDDPYACKRLGSEITVGREWLLTRVECMEELLEVKQPQSISYSSALTQDTRCVFVEETLLEFWGQGIADQGRNTLGCLHGLTRCKIIVGRL